jgi:hypothetical protein
VWLVDKRAVCLIINFQQDLWLIMIYIYLQMSIRDEVRETNAEVHRELNNAVGKRVIKPNEESLRKRQKQLDGKLNLRLHKKFM